MDKKETIYKITKNIWKEPGKFLQLFKRTHFSFRGRMFWEQGWSREFIIIPTLFAKIYGPVYNRTYILGARWGFGLIRGSIGQEIDI